MSITILPKTRLDKWSVGLAASFIVLFALFRIFNWELAIYAALISSTAALFTGVISITKSKEWSIPGFVATLVGLIVLFYVLVVFLFDRAS